MMRFALPGGRWPHLAWTALALALLLVHAVAFHFVIDDAYISFRYAQNLIDGHGLVFNPGEPVEGYSNLSWVLLCALGMKLGLGPLLWARLLGTACLGGTLLLLPGAVRALSPRDPARGEWPGRAAQLVLAAAGPVACWTLGGLETPLFLLAMTAAWRSALERRPLAAGLIGLLLVLTRPEGAAPALFFLAWSLLPPGRGSVRGAAAGPERWLGPAVLVGGAAAFFLWRHATYGYWLPNTYYAKTGDLSGQLAAGLPYTLDFLRRLAWPLLVAAVVAAVRTRTGRLREREMLLSLAWLLLWSGYVTVVGGDMLGMFRFYAPVLPLAIAWAIAALAGTGWLDRAAPALAIAVVLGLALLPGSKFGREPWLALSHMRVANLGGWILAGDAMAEQLPPGTTIALGPAGYIPWRTGFRALDYYGIVTPHIAHRDVDFASGNAGHEKHDGAWIVAQRPDYLLIGNVDVTPQPRTGRIPVLEVEKEIVLDPDFAPNYEMFHLRLADGKWLNCARRKDAPR